MDAPGKHGSYSGNWECDQPNKQGLYMFRAGGGRGYSTQAAYDGNYVEFNFFDGVWNAGVAGSGVLWVDLNNKQQYWQHERPRFSMNAEWLREAGILELVEEDI